MSDAGTALDRAIDHLQSALDLIDAYGFGDSVAGFIDLGLVRLREERQRQEH